MRTNISIFLILIVNILISQNLVLNPSFEIHKKCPSIIGMFKNNVEYWSVPNLATTDYFNTCSKRVGIKNYNGSQNPKTGEGFAGIYVYAPKNYREYIQGKLSKTLVKGKKYKVSFYVSLSLYSTHSIKDFKILFTQERLGLYKKRKNESILTSRKLNAKIFSNISEKFIVPSNLTDKKFDFYAVEDFRFYSKKGDWMKIELTMQAKGYENNIIVGTFESNKKLEKSKVLSSSESQFAYYYIDDISVVALEEVSPPVINKTMGPAEAEIIAPELDKEIIFKNVLFEFDKAELFDESLNELNTLYSILEGNRDLRVDIYGHTDNLGSNERNFELSEERAQAVAQYLLSQGLDESRIQWKGYGSKQPIADNTTEEGRAKNRRVAFKLISN